MLNKKQFIEIVLTCKDVKSVVLFSYKPLLLKFFTKAVIYMIEKIKKLIFSEAFKYLFIGGCTTLVNLVVFWVLCNLTPLGNNDAGITVANVISVTVSILFAFVTNKVIVFRSKTHTARETFIEMVKFVGARLSTMVIEVGGVWLAVSVLNQHEMVGKLETQVLVIIGNYFISKFFVFKKQK